VLINLKDRGFESLGLAVDDGVLGFWKASRKVFDETRGQRCWFRKTAKILSKLSKHSQVRVEQCIHDIWRADQRK